MHIAYLFFVHSYMLTIAQHIHTSCVHSRYEFDEG